MSTDREQINERVVLMVTEHISGLESQLKYYERTNSELAQRVDELEAENLRLKEHIRNCEAEAVPA